MHIVRVGEQSSNIEKRRRNENERTESNGEAEKWRNGENKRHALVVCRWAALPGRRVAVEKADASGRADETRSASLDRSFESRPGRSSRYLARSEAARRAWSGVVQAEALAGAGLDINSGRAVFTPALFPVVCFVFSFSCQHAQRGVTERERRERGAEEADEKSNNMIIQRSRRRALFLSPENVLRI